MAFRSRFPLLRSLTPLAAAASLALLAAGPALAQASDPTSPAAAPQAALQSAAALEATQAASAEQGVQSVLVTGHTDASAADVTGFGTPLSRTPIQATVIDSQTLADIGALTLSDLTRLDASVTDSYNAPGYWSTFAVRGFQVDNRTNFRRDGLPINAETMLPLENKSAVEVLKGLSGIQSGTSAPGGLVNLVVKRPDVDLRSVSLLWEQDGTVDGRVDLSQRFGESRQFGARLNVSAAHLDPQIHDLEGHRQTASIATDWRIDADHVLEFEFEHSLQNQPSVPGFSMLGPVVPSPQSIDPRINLNDQPWSLPVVMQGNTMSLRYTQRLDADWSFRLQALQQRLVSNDHLAFPYGLYDPVTYECDPCDRYSSDGHFSIWDFRSDDERRTTGDLDASVSGVFRTGTLKHSLTVGALETIFTGRFQDSAYNLVGVGTIDGKTVVPADPTLTTPNVDRTERSTELYARDAIEFANDTTAWLGVRHTRLHRSSSETSLGTPDDDTDYRQSFTTPWLALSHQLGAQDMVYASWGEGVESDVAPTMGSADLNRGQPLTPTISRQWEIGYKHGNAATHWGLDVFDVKQAFDTDIETDAGTVFAHDGITHSRGIEAEAQTRFDALTLRASAMWQRVRREDASDPTQDGLRPTNVPDSALTLLAAYAFTGVPGLTAIANMTYEGEREVLPDNSAQIPAWTRFDLGARYAQNVGAATTLVWRVGVDNVFDRRAWRESPYQYGHVYLYPLEPRTWRASVEASF